MTKSSSEFLTKSFLTMNFVGRYFTINLCIALFVWVLFIAVPFDIVVSNSKEFTYVYGSEILYNAAKYGLVTFISLNILYLAITLLFRKYLCDTILYLFIATAISVWLNSTFLVGVYGQFDGRGNLQIEPFSKLNFVQICAFFIIFVLTFVFRKYPKAIVYTIGTILIITFSTGTINIVSKIGGNNIMTTSEESYFRYSANNPNILFIILDEYQSDYFAQILDNDLKKDFDNFIWYEDTVANFPTTIAAFPAIFSGEIYQNKIGLDEFYAEASRNSIVNRISDEGGLVNYTHSPPNSDKLFPNGTLTSFAALNDKNLGVYNNLLNYSLFRASPDMLKPYIYNDERWLIQLDKEDPYKELGGIGASFKALNFLANHKVTASRNYPSTFKFHHSVVTHSPTVLGSDCEPIGIVDSNLENKSAEGLCAIGLTVKLIEKLKEANVFDNTMIIIASDHGSIFQPNGFPSDLPYSVAASTLLIKPLYNDAEFRISKYPAQLSDIPITIASALKITNDYQGVDLLSLTKSEFRTRIFNYYFWSKEYHDWSKSNVPPITKFVINGPINNPANWKKKGIDTPIVCNSKLAFSSNDKVLYSEDFGWSFRETWGRWTDGPATQMSFKVEEQCDLKALKFKLNAFVTSKNPEQTANVFINEESVGRIKIELSTQFPKEYVFEIPDVNNNNFTVRFEIDQPTSPESIGISEDARSLGLGFISMELVSATSLSRD